MKITFNKSHKSIRSFPAIEIPDFVVLTGVNGAGKSHLLEALEVGALTVEGVLPNQSHGARPIRRYESNSLVPNDSGPYSGAQISNEVSSVWASILQLRTMHFENLMTNLRSVQIPKFDELNIGFFKDIDVSSLLSIGVQKENSQEMLSHIENQFRHIEAIISSSFLQQDPNGRGRLNQDIVAAGKFPFCFMDREEFYGLYSENTQVVDLFQQSFARLFSSYQYNWRENELRKIGNQRGASITFLTEAQFIEKFGEPPWDFVNEILRAAELGFVIDRPDEWLDRPYDPVLLDPKRGIEIKFANLSSGERILISFALCLYHVNDRRSNVEYPQVLLFDEIDAPLHPSMTRSLLRTIEKTLVEERGIKVILTTHSPSTVALAPDSSIYAMSKIGEQRFSKVTKDAALGILTAGVPTLSVNYENRRQIFVESKYDVRFYSAIFEKAKNFLNREISLNFIASGVGGHGNCDQVRAVVDQLSQAGNRTVSGIIDWDLVNKPSLNIHVIGYNERYAIDNYLLDPLFIAILLVREKIAPSDLMGDDAELTYAKLLASDISRLDIFANRVVDAIGRTLDDDLKSSAQEEVCFQYLGGDSVVVPRWFACMRGHDLEIRLKDVYPGLRRFKGESDLKQRVIDCVLEDRPELIPASIVSLLKKIQES